MSVRLAAMAVAAATLVMVVVALRVRRPNVVPEGPGLEEDDTPLPPARAPRSPGPPRVATTAEAPTPAAAEEGLGHLYGRVLVAPGGDEEDLDDLEIVAFDGERSFEPAVGERGTFELHVPPTTLRLTARAGGHVGVVMGVAVVADSDRQVTITLGPAAVIRGTVRWGVDTGKDLGVATVHARAAAISSSVEAVVEDDGSFTLDGLVPGVSYDLRASHDDARPATLTGVRAPAQGVALTLERLPVLRGAVGLDRHGDCPVRRVSLDEGLPGEDDDDDGGSHRVDRRCRFEAPLRGAPGTRVRVTATGPGWQLASTVEIPALGDPAELCLNPPCGQREVRVPGRIRVLMPGAAARSFTAWARTEAHAQASCRHTNDCILEVPAGKPATVGVDARGCDTGDSQAATVRSGELVTLTFPCRQLRDVLGVVRGGDSGPGRITIRCGDRERAVSNSGTFTLLCPTDAAGLDVRTHPGGDWRTVPFPPGPSHETALVEVRLP